MSVQENFVPTFNAPVFYVFSIKDIKTGTYMTPYFQTHKPAALRAFSDLVNDSQSMIYRHPADFELFELGSYDSGSGLLTSHQIPQHLATGTDFKGL